MPCRSRKTLGQRKLRNNARTREAGKASPGTETSAGRMSRLIASVYLTCGLDCDPRVFPSPRSRPSDRVRGVRRHRDGDDRGVRAPLPPLDTRALDRNLVLARMLGCRGLHQQPLRVALRPTSELPELEKIRIFITGNVGIVFGLALMIRGQVAEGDAGSFIDALIVATAAGVLSWIFLMAPSAQASHLELASARRVGHLSELRRGDAGDAGPDVLHRRKTHLVVLVHGRGAHLWDAGRYDFCGASGPRQLSRSGGSARCPVSPLVRLLGYGRRSAEHGESHRE